MDRCRLPAYRCGGCCPILFLDRLPSQLLTLGIRCRNYVGPVLSSLRASIRRAPQCTSNVSILNLRRSRIVLSVWMGSVIRNVVCLGISCSIAPDKAIARVAPMARCRRSYVIPETHKNQNRRGNCTTQDNERVAHACFAQPRARSAAGRGFESVSQIRSLFAARRPDLAVSARDGRPHKSLPLAYNAEVCCCAGRPADLAAAAQSPPKLSERSARWRLPRTW